MSTRAWPPKRKFWVSSSPAIRWKSTRDKLEDLRALSTADIAAIKSSTGKDENICTAGIITNLRVLKSKKGDFYAQGALEDMAGSVEMIVFPGSLPQAAGQGEA